MKLSISGTPVYVVSDAAAATEILKTHDADFANKYPLAFGVARYDNYDDYHFVNTPNGPYWRFMRKLCVTQLFAGPQMDRFMHIREEETTKLVRSLREKSRLGEPCDMGRELSGLANGIICRMAIGKRCDEDVGLPAEIRACLRETMVQAGRLSFVEVFGPLKGLDIFGNGRKLVAKMRVFDRLMERVMNKYEEEETSSSDREILQRGEGKDTMDLLLETYRDQNAELKLSREHIKRFFLDVFLAGVDTTAATIQFGLVELINNPKIFHRLRAEIDSVVGPNRVVKESDVSNLPYLQAIVKETLRKHPAGPLLRRQCMADTTVNGYDVKAGTKIIVNAYAIMRDADTWKDPDEFAPERFLLHQTTSSEDNYYDYKGVDCRFLPFGSGRRACPAATHGLVVAHMAIAALVQCFDWEVMNDGDEVDHVKVVTGYSGATPFPFTCYPVSR